MNLSMGSRDDGEGHPCWEHLVGRPGRVEVGFMPERETKVVGYFAYFSPTQVVCSDVAACVVAGSIQAMEEYLAEIDPRRAPKATVKKTRFGEIKRGLQLGAA